MKKIKAILWLLVIGFVALVVYQNLPYFQEQNELGINLYFKKYQTPEFANGFLILACFIIGFLLSYFFSLGERFKSSRTIRALKATVDSHLEQIGALKKEVENLRPAVESPVPPAAPTEPVDPPGDS